MIETKDSIEGSRPFQVQIELLFLFEDEDVHGIASNLERQPRIVRKKGEIDFARNLPPFGKISMYSSADSWGASLQKHIDDILTVPAHDIEVLCRFSRSSQMIIIVNYCEDIPLLKLPNELVRLASIVGGGIEFYFYGD